MSATAEKVKKRRKRRHHHPVIRHNRKIIHLRSDETHFRDKAAATGVSDHDREKLTHKAEVAAAKAKYLELQNNRTTHNGHLAYPFITILKFVFGFIFCLEVGILSVSGVYDVLLELPIPTKIYSGIIAAVGLAFLVGGFIAYLHSRKESRPIASTVASMVTGVILLLASGVAFYFAFTHPAQHTVTDAYHFLMQSPDQRHLFMRKLPEGLVSGLLSVYWFFKCGLRAAKNFAYYYWPLRWFSVPGDSKKAETWKLMVVPVMAIAFAVGTWLALYYLLLWHHHDQGVLDWVHHKLPFHWNVVPAATQTGFLGTFVASITVAWPAFIIGFVSARFWGRAPSMGPTYDAVQYEALHRVAKSGGRLEGEGRGKRGALRFWQSRPHQAEIIGVYLDGQAYPGGAVAYAKSELDKIGRGVRSLFLTVEVGLLPLAIIGFVFVYIIAKKGG
jgi:hypothetical protein